MFVFNAVFAAFEKQYTYICMKKQRPFCYRMLFTVVLLLCFSFVSQAQIRTMKVCGLVTDKQSREVLIGASVTVAGTTEGSVTDVSGHYRLSVPLSNKVTLRFSYLGYHDREITVRLSSADSTVCNVALSADAHTLDEVQITARSEARMLRESAMPVSVISQRQLQGTASNINDILARTVGVTVRNTGGIGSSSRISVRGLEGKRMGMFIDETPMGQLGNFVALNDIPTNMIERIEVYKGIVPYKFGGSALGGAVNVVTKEYPPVYLDVSYTIGSFNSHQLTTVLKRTDHRSGLQFGVGGILTYSDNDYRMKLENLGGRIVRRNHDNFRKMIGGMSLKATKWWFDELKWELILMHTRQEIQGIDMDVREAFNHSTSLVTSLKLKRQNFFLDGLDLDMDVAYMLGRYGLNDRAMQRYDWDGNKLPPVSPLGGEQNSYPSDGKNRSHDASVKLNLGYTIDIHHAFNLNVYAAGTYLHPKDELMDKALGFSANFPSRVRNLTTGFSYDLTLLDGKFQNAFTLKDFYYSSNSKSISIYSIREPDRVKTSKNYFGFSNAMRYRITPDWMIKASFNSEVRIPTSEELIGNGYSILPSLGLKPERTTGVNLGALYHRQKADGGIVELELNTFYNTLHDMVRFTQDVIPTMARYRNFGSVRTMGVELEAKSDVLPVLYLYANGTYQDLRDTRKFTPGTDVENPTKGKRIPNVPYLLANFGAEYHQENLFGGRGQNTRVLFDASYVHQYYYDFEVSSYQDRKIPTSFTMDAAVEHSFANDRWTLTFRLKNLADRRVVSEFNRPLPGRSVAFTVRYLFK